MKIHEESGKWTLVYWLSQIHSYVCLSEKRILFPHHWWSKAVSIGPIFPKAHKPGLEAPIKNSVCLRYGFWSQSWNKCECILKQQELGCNWFRQRRPSSIDLIPILEGQKFQDQPLIEDGSLQNREKTLEIWIKDISKREKTIEASAS
jgi:hypothetical protein